MARRLLVVRYAPSRLAIRQGHSATLRWTYRPEFDGCRALAILAVVGYHYLPGIFGGGYVGVEVFFVLSGYLITGLLRFEHADRNRIDLRAFYARRILRLYPALIAVVVGAIVLVVVTGHRGQSTLVVAESVAASLFYVADFASLKGRFIGFLDPTWSLGVEEQFYIAWPLVLIWALRRASVSKIGMWCRSVALALCVADVAFRVLLGSDATYFTPLGNAAPLLLGCSVALSAGRWRWPGTFVCAAGAYLAVFAFVGPNSRDVALWLGPQQVAGVAAVIGIAWLAAGSTSRVLASRPLVWLGRRSYGLYLWHQAVLVGLDRELPHASTGVVALIGIPLSVLIAAASYRYIEQPFLRRKARFARVPGEAAASLPAGA